MPLSCAHLGPHLTWTGTELGRVEPVGAGNKVEPSLSPLRLWGGVLRNPGLIHHRSPRGIDHFPTAQCPQAMMALRQGPPSNYEK